MKTVKKLYQRYKKTADFLIKMAIICVTVLLVTNAIVMIPTSSKIQQIDELTDKSAEYIIVLGCGVWQNGQPSHMLQDRLDSAIELYNNGVSDRILMTGDNRSDDYNEVGVMKQYAIDHGVPSEDIYVDPYGLSTYDSISRAKSVFGIEKAVIVTQKYHTYRALFIADSFGIDALAIPSNPRTYSGQIFRDAREAVARTKEIVYCIFKPSTDYQSEPIDQNLNGDEVNLKQ